jgi:hypothetical protein
MIADWVSEVARILVWIESNRIAFAEITLTVKGGKVTFIDYRGPLRGEDRDKGQEARGKKEEE